MTRVEEEHVHTGELSADSLGWRCRPEELGFHTTEEVADLEEVLGQPRAVAAVELAMGVERSGFNLFAFGLPGTGRHSLVHRHLESRAASRPAPADVCYVHDFQDTHRCRLLRLPPGRGRELRRDVEQLVHELPGLLSAAFESEETQGRRKAIDEEIEGRQREAWSLLADDARQHGLSVRHTPGGLVFAPVRGEEVVTPEEYERLPAEERQRLEREVERIKGEVERLFRRIPGWARERRRRLEELDRQMAALAVEPLLSDVRQRFSAVEAVAAYLAEVEQDVVDRARSIAAGEAGEPEEGSGVEGGTLRRYRVNLLVDHGETTGAPVVYEDNPTLANLVGRVEYRPHLGVLVTDHTLIRPGALHRANGGYLVLDAERVLGQPGAWEALKRALRSRQVKVESLGQMLGILSAASLEPAPMPLDLKVVLIGEPLLYYLLEAYEPDFPSLFKVAAELAADLERTPEHQRLYARLVAGMVRHDGLRPFDAGAVARVIEHGARLAGDARKLSIHVGPLLELLQEADHRAGQDGRRVVAAEDVERAIRAQIHRSDLSREHVHELIRRGVLQVDLGGEAVGQVNGLAVSGFDRFAFGHPVRITARVRLGEGEVLDVEREAELSGPLHAKGVMILQGFLGQRYATALPLSLHATLVFEQSYGGVEGDSASLAELCALLSAAGRVPVSQAVAVTGSVNQHGRVQAIGAVNEKVEGFFDVCAARGLSGRQGVIVPVSNREHLMLRHDVVEAVAAGTFHVWAVATVDEALEILTGLPAGERDELGSYPEGSVNLQVEQALHELAVLRMAFEKGQWEAVAEPPAETPEPSSGVPAMSVRPPDG